MRAEVRTRTHTQTNGSAHTHTHTHAQHLATGWAARFSSLQFLTLTCQCDYGGDVGALLSSLASSSIQLRQLCLPKLVAPSLAVSEGIAKLARAAAGGELWEAELFRMPPSCSVHLLKVRRLVLHHMPTAAEASSWDLPGLECLTFKSFSIDLPALPSLLRAKLPRLQTLLLPLAPQLPGGPPPLSPAQADALSAHLRDLVLRLVPARS